MDQNTETPKSNITRRRLLQHALIVVSSTLMPSMLFPENPSQTAPEQTRKPETESVIETPPLKIITLEDQLFKNFSDDEKLAVEPEIINYKESYQNDSKRAERVLDWEKSTLQPILDLDVPKKDHQFWREFMSAVVFVESEGKTQAISKVGIVGIAQISETTAKDTARKHGILKFDLTKGWDSLRLSRFHFQDLMEKYEADISLLAYYAGSSFTDQKISASSSKEPNIANLGSTDGVEYLSKVVAASRILSLAQTRG